MGPHTGFFLFGIGQEPETISGNIKEGSAQCNTAKVVCSPKGLVGPCEINL